MSGAGSSDPASGTGDPGAGAPPGSKPVLPWPWWRQILSVALVGLVVILATPTGLFLRGQVARQIGELLRLAPWEASWEERRLRVLGPDYRFLAFARDRTDPDHVIVMTDQFAPSLLDPERAKKELWASYFLYPRRILYLHQDEDRRYREATWLVVDDPVAVAWIDPRWRPPYEEGALGLVPFELGAYLDAIEAGEVPARYAPPTRALRGFSLEGERR